MHSFDTYIQTVAACRRPLQSAVFGLALISLLLNLDYGLMLHQTGRNPILTQDVDPTYWGAMILGLPRVAGSSMALLFDLAVLASCVASMIWNRQRVTPLIFFALHYIYFLLFNMIAAHHYINIGLLFMSFPFVFYHNGRFAATFTFCRFIFCFMLVAAGLWKVARGNLFYPEQGQLLLIATHIESLAQNDASLYFGIIRFFITHQALSYLLWPGMIALELLFALGFITVKRDWLLLVAYGLFAAGGYFFYYIYNYENLLFLLTLAPVLHLVKAVSARLQKKGNPAAATLDQSPV